MGCCASIEKEGNSVGIDAEDEIADQNKNDDRRIDMKAPLSSNVDLTAPDFSPIHDDNITPYDPAHTPQTDGDERTPQSDIGGDRYDRKYKDVVKDIVHKNGTEIDIVHINNDNINNNKKQDELTEIENDDKSQHNDNEQEEEDEFSDPDILDINDEHNKMDTKNDDDKNFDLLYSDKTDVIDMAETNENRNETVTDTLDALYTKTEPTTNEMQEHHVMDDTDPRFKHEWNLGLKYDAKNSEIILNLVDDITNKKWIKRVTAKDVNVERDAMRSEFNKIGDIVNNGKAEYIINDDGYCHMKLSKNNDVYEFIAQSTY